VLQAGGIGALKGGFRRCHSKAQLPMLCLKLSVRQSTHRGENPGDGLVLGRRQLIPNFSLIRSSATRVVFAGANKAIRIAAWLTRAKFTHGSLVIVHDSAHAILLVRQRLRERDCWGLPGGFLNLHEAPIDGARRELREETGLAVDSSALTKVAEYHQPWAWHYDHLFRIDLPDGHTTELVRPRANLELSGIGWYQPSQLPPLNRSARLALAHETAIG